MTLEAIKEAIQHLPAEERRELADWFEQMEEAAWDAEIERDFAPGGRGEALEKRIRCEIAEGKARPLEEGLAKRRRSEARVFFHRWTFGIYTRRPRFQMLGLSSPHRPQQTRA